LKARKGGMRFGRPFAKVTRRWWGRMEGKAMEEPEERGRLLGLAASKAWKVNLRHSSVSYRKRVYKTYTRIHF
jgi:hypothetical protein